MNNYSSVPFSEFSTAVREQFERMCNSGNPLVEVDIPRQDIEQHYLSSFPEGTNKLFRERREYDCNCCLQFIARIGRVVEVTQEGLKTIWDIDVNLNLGYYNIVAKAMRRKVLSADFRRMFISEEQVAGGPPNLDNYSEIVWDHFHAHIPTKFIQPADRIGTARSNLESAQTVLLKGLTQFTESSLVTVSELTEGGSIYRGLEHALVTRQFLELYREYQSADPAQKRFILYSHVTQPHLARYANSVIGTLVEDLSSDVPLERAVASFESKVAPTNYRRTTAVVSPRMIEDARKAVEKLGMLDSLARRFATPNDLTADNLLFVSQPSTFVDPFAAAMRTTPVTKTTRTVTMAEFLETVLPKAKELEILFQSKLNPRLVSLVTAEHADAPNLFPWSNPFSWSYRGDTTDAIAERVKAAGGSVSGDVVVSLAWACSDDLDLHIRPKSKRAGDGIYYGNRKAYGGLLDVDMNAGGRNNSTDPVENISFQNLANMPDDDYVVVVNNYHRRSSASSAFTVRIDIQGSVENFDYPQNIRDSQTVEVCTIRKKGNSVWVADRKLSSEGAAETNATTWGITTGHFVPVTSAFLSPNYWGSRPQGNQHVFFMLDGCQNPEPVRGFYSEFLVPELLEHRRSFEVLGSVTKSDVSARDQLSGLGFSHTDSFDFTIRVTSETGSQVIKIAQ